MLCSAPPAAPVAQDSNLLSGPTSLFGPKQCAVRNKLLPPCPPPPPTLIPTQTLALSPQEGALQLPFCSAMTTQQLPSCPSPFPLHILYVFLATSSHHHSPTSFPFFHPTFWVGFPSLLMKSKGKRGGEACGLGRGHGSIYCPWSCVPPPTPLGSPCKRSKRTAKIAKGEELVGLTSGGQKQLLLLSRQEVKEEG